MNTLFAPFLAYIKQFNSRLVGLCMLFLIAGFLTACDVMAQPDQDSLSTEFETMRIQENHPDYTVDISYPQTLNRKIDHKVSEFISQRLVRFKDDLLETALSETQAGDNQYTLNARIAYHSDGVLAIRISESARIGPSEALEVVHTFNFNRYTGEDIALDNLFPHQADYLQVLSALSYKELIEDPRLSGVDAAMLWEGTQPFSQNFSTFLFENTTLTLIFNSGQVAPAGYGAISIHLQLSDLSQQLAYNAKAFEANYVSIYPIFPVVLEGVASNESAYFKPVEPVKVELKAGEKPIALTFDDGPHPKFTLQVAKVLDAYKIKGTFFVIGKRARAYPQVLEQVAAQGHSIGNHTWSHPQLTKLSTLKVQEQVDMTQRTVERITGKAPKYLRVPYGRFNQDILTWANMPLIQWSVDPEDWKSRDAQNIAGHIIEHTKSGDIILLHDIHSATVEALPVIIEQLQKQGFVFVTVDQLIDLKKGQVYYKGPPKAAKPLD